MAKNMLLTRAAAVAAISAVVAPAAILMAAGAAHARPMAENTIKGECKSAGGTYSTFIESGGARLSSCSYTDISGNRYTDHYTNGEYVFTL